MTALAWSRTGKGRYGEIDDRDVTHPRHLSFWITADARTRQWTINAAIGGRTVGPLDLVPSYSEGRATVDRAAVIVSRQLAQEYRDALGQG
jgi:hypothetical protein